MSACDLIPGSWYRYHGTPALFVGRDACRQYNFEITTGTGTLSVRIGAARLDKEITTI